MWFSRLSYSVPRNSVQSTTPSRLALLLPAGGQEKSAMVRISTEELRREPPRAAPGTIGFANGGMARVVWHNERALGAIR